jgi:hypothetical protein
MIKTITAGKDIYSISTASSQQTNIRKTVSFFPKIRQLTKKTVILEQISRI